ncbi:hypothetical protein KRP22_013977 [Phytophthora ramorum]|nr:hypothetical protein KRP22_13805 [Phytophthora ramorum]
MFCRLSLSITCRVRGEDGVAAEPRHRRRKERDMTGDLDPKARQIHVLVKIPLLPSKRPRLEQLEEIPRIDLPEKAYVTLPAELVAKCGLKSEGVLMLYCRSQVLDLWRYLKNEVVAKNVKSYIVGARKSACTLAFAAPLNREEWDVVWIHASRNSTDTCLAVGINEFWVIEELSTFCVPREEIFVCLDGINAEQTHTAFVKRVLANLRDDDRLVIRSSMATLGKRNDEDDALAKIQPYFMYSWTQEEYLAAIHDKDCYATVRDKFDATSTSEVNDEGDDDEKLSGEDERKHVFALKFYYAGASCQFMCQYTTEKVKSIINRAIRSAAIKAELATYCLGEFHSDAINKL